MNIDLHFIGFNESETIHLTIKHYQQFCRKVYYYDNFSTDNTREIAEAMGCDVRMFGVAGQLNDAEYLKVKNNCWKGSDADWVIVCDADEILTTPERIYRMSQYCSLLKTGNEPTIFKTEGFNMFSNSLPTESWDEIFTGIQDDNYSKLCIFNPNAITEINYVYGCHQANPVGRVKFSNDTLHLLHYKHVGGAQRLADRHALYASRMSDLNKRWKLGFQYMEPREQTIKYFNENLAKARPLW